MRRVLANFAYLDGPDWRYRLILTHCWLLAGGCFLVGGPA